MKYTMYVFILIIGNALCTTNYGMFESFKVELSQINNRSANAERACVYIAELMQTVEWPSDSEIVQTMTAPSSSEFELSKINIHYNVQKMSKLCTIRQELNNKIICNPASWYYKRKGEYFLIQASQDIKKKTESLHTIEKNKVFKSFEPVKKAKECLWAAI